MQKCPKACFDAINSAFSTDLLIDESGHVLLDQENGVIVVDHKLGISSDVLKALFRYCISELNALGCSRKSTNSRDTGEWPLEHELTRALLLVKGDMPTLLAKRKCLVTEGLVDCETEIRLTKIVLTRHPKAPSIWFHRRFCQQILCSRLPNLGSQWKEAELEFIARMCDVYPRNYYAWNHRLWLSLSLDFGALVSELDNNVVWLKSHTTDHSAVSFRMQVIAEVLKRVQDESVPCSHPLLAPSAPLSAVPLPNGGLKAELSILYHEFEISDSVIASRWGSGLGVETAWLHRRGVFCCLWKVISKFFFSGDGQDEKGRANIRMGGENQITDKNKTGLDTLAELAWILSSAFSASGERGGSLTGQAIRRSHLDEWILTWKGLERRLRDSCLSRMRGNFPDISRVHEHYSEKYLSFIDYIVAKTPL